jgi:hypothetical protein
MRHDFVGIEGFFVFRADPGWAGGKKKAVLLHKWIDFGHHLSSHARSAGRRNGWHLRLVNELAGLFTGA